MHPNSTALLLQNALWWQMDLINNAALYCVCWKSQAEPSRAQAAVARWSPASPPPVHCMESWSVKSVTGYYCEPLSAALKTQYSLHCIKVFSAFYKEAIMVIVERWHHRVGGGWVGRILIYHVTLQWAGALLLLWNFNCYQTCVWFELALKNFRQNWCTSSH